MGVFINFSNHPSSKWGSKQLAEAQKYGEVVDIPFPELDANLSEEDVEVLGNEIVKQIVSFNPTAVMCQGEFTLTYYVVNELEKLQIECLSACTSRVTKERTLKNGIVQKESYFEFKKFRKYV